MRAGIDIGGTKTNMGLFDSGRLIQSQTSRTGTIDQIVSEFYDFVHKACAPSAIESIGVGVPGTVDHEAGQVIFAPNLGWENIDIRSAFCARFDVPFFLGQDTKCAALGELCCGAGQGHSDLICITVGTGIGCGLIMGGRLHTGRYNTAGEFGHMIAVSGGRRCNCGRAGCLEAYASGTGIARTYLEYIENGRASALISKPAEAVTSEDVFAAAKAGCTVANEIIRGAVDILAIGIINSINLTGPEAVIISGGISSERELFMTPLFQKVNNGIYTLLKDRVHLSVAALGADAPMYGAGALYRFL